MKNRKAEQRFPLRRVATGTLILAMFSAQALAADALSPDSEWMFGDWGGYRTQLQDDGIKFDVNYTMESAANLGGGADTNTTMRYSDQWSFGTNFDLQKLLDWQDAEFQMTVTSRNGQNLSEQVADQRTGMLSSVQEVYGRGQTWRLTQFWLRKGLFNDVVDVKAGRVTVGEDFDNFDGNLFQNLALGSGQAGNWRGDRWFNWPVSQWGGRVKFNITPDVSSRSVSIIRTALTTIAVMVSVWIPAIQKGIWCRSNWAGSQPSGRRNYRVTTASAITIPRWMAMFMAAGATAAIRIRPIPMAAICCYSNS